MSKSPTLPQYRVRLFLSVDLAGSTAFKTSSSEPSWIRIFRSFYSNFHKTYQAEFLKFCESNTECNKFSTRPPKLWKTVGDEVIFVSRVDDLFEVFAHVHAFDQSLNSYKIKLKGNRETSSLDVKGNGWVAAFPYPNQTISMKNSHTENFIDEFADESHELEADENPSDFEFLGPGIDSGFRIAANSKPSLFTLSPALTYLLCRANTNRDYAKYKFDLTFTGVNQLKGVAKGAPYPIVGINTERDKSTKDVVALQQSLLGESDLDSAKLADYLEKFAALYEIDIPQFSVNSQDGGLIPSTSYIEKFTPIWQKITESEGEQDKNYLESADHDGTDQQREEPKENIEAITSFLSDVLSAAHRLGASSSDSDGENASHSS